MNILPREENLYSKGLKNTGFLLLFVFVVQSLSRI